MRICASLLKASVVAGLAFTVAWIRPPLDASLLARLFYIFILTNCVLATLSLLVGLPLVALVERLRIGSRWLYMLIAAVTGALVAAGMGHRGPIEGGVENRHGGAVFSPFDGGGPRIDHYPASQFEYLSSIAFCAMVGAVLGIAFWRFYSRRPRPHDSLERTRDR